MEISILQKQLQRLKYLLSQPSTDVSYSKYISPKEVIDELDLIEKKVLKFDDVAVNKLLFLIAPTGDLQEISISSGWGYEFLDIAEAIERALGRG